MCPVYDVNSTKVELQMVNVQDIASLPVAHV